MMKNLRNFVLLSAVALSAAACDGILDVSDPTRVEEEDLAKPVGIELLRVEAVTQLYDAVSQAAFHTGLVSDEYFYVPSSLGLQSGTLYTETVLDQRLLRGMQAENLAKAVYEKWNAARIAAIHAINWHERYASEAQKPILGQLLAIKGHSTLALGEQVCSGFPLHDVDFGRPIYTGPLTTTQVLETAVEILEEAVDAAGDNEEYANFAKVSLGRALLALGRFDDAAKAVADVPTSYVFNGEYGTGTTAKPNRLRVGSFSRTSAARGVSDNEGGNGIDFVSANDPRLQLTRLGENHTGHEFFAATKYQQTNSPITIASGLEARLIEAEAALHNNDPSWLTILNDLRATQITPGMEPLLDPGTADARVDLLFRERAFWLFGTAHRLGDLRRLVDVYGRAPETVFPTGDYVIGGKYDVHTSLPFPIVGEDWAGKGVTGCID